MKSDRLDSKGLASAGVELEEQAHETCTFE